jgi:hypothetical protein
MRYSLIEVVDGVNLFSDEVVQSVGSAREEQAVTDPLDRLNAAKFVCLSVAVSPNITINR